MTYTGIDVLNALREIAESIHNDYAAKAAEAQGRTEKKAFIIQKEMAGLCIRCGLLVHTNGDYIAGKMNRMLHPTGFLALTDETCYNAYCALPLAEREIITPYIHGLYFMEQQMLAKWRQEIKQYQQLEKENPTTVAISDTQAGMEVQLKYKTAMTVLHAWQAWWISHTSELPALPPMPVMKQILS